MIITCKECGAKEETTRYHNWYDLESRQECHECNFFLHADKRFRIIVNGEMYYVGPETDNPKYKGFGGRTFIIRKNGGEKIITTNLNYNGIVPDCLRDRLPDNAIFL